MSSDSEKFSKYLKGSGKQGLDLLNQYHKCQCGMMGSGKPRKMKGKALVNSLIQNGGSWASFTNWVKGAANTVASGVKKGANFVYDKAVKPGFEYVKSKPLTALGTVAGLAGSIPSPFSAPLKAIGAAAGTAGRLTGYGQNGGARRDESGKVIMAFP